MDQLVLLIFAIVYIGLALGGVPGLALDRTGVTLLGLIALLAAGRLSLEGLKSAVDLPTITLLFGLMVLSAQFRLGGFYTHVVRRLTGVRSTPPKLLAVFIAVTATLSAVLANDIVCLAVTPIMVEACAGRRLNPIPFLLALACAANIGSAATIIGNPQNMLIGQVLQISFIGYFLQALPPVLVGLGLTWLVIALAYRGRWEGEASFEHLDAPVFNSWQTSKGLVILFVLMVFFLLDPAPRETAALVGAAILLCSRRMRSREMLGLVDWQLLLLFISLFALNHVMKASGNLDLIADAMRGASITLESPFWLFALCLPLSNIVSNVPAVMLLLPYAQHPAAGTVLALSSTLAGNLIIVGSIANIIVVEQAARMGVAITWKEHAKIGVPVTLTSMAVTGLWLWLTY